METFDLEKVNQLYLVYNQITRKNLLYNLARNIESINYSMKQLIERDKIFGSLSSLKSFKGFLQI